jgi:hypothetical protein
MSEERKMHLPAAEPCGREPTEKPPNYDMEDSEEDYERWRSLAPLLRDCEATVLEAYHGADSASRRYQVNRRWVVTTAAVCGMLAVLFAIVQLAIFQLPSPVQSRMSWVKHGEIAAVIAALVAVVVFGLRAALPTKWLLERERAERYRTLKFRFLFHPEVWSEATPEERQDWLRSQIAGIKALDKESLEGWAKGENVASEVDLPGLPVGLDDEVIIHLSSYYKEKRLCWQKDYFDDQVGRRHLWERLTKVAPVLFFFLSILAAMAHFVWDLEVLNLSGEAATHPTEAQGGGSLRADHDPISLWLIVLAAGLPVVGAAIRTVRTAHEFGRNTLRFQAASNELEHLGGKLEDETDPQAHLKVLHSVEEVLEAERREWMRLMIEAEWFA